MKEGDHEVTVVNHDSIHLISSEPHDSDDDWTTNTRRI
jgi:hypothetical protein